MWRLPAQNRIVVQRRWGRGGWVDVKQILSKEAACPKMILQTMQDYAGTATFSENSICFATQQVTCRNNALGSPEWPPSHHVPSLTIINLSFSIIYHVPSNGSPIIYLSNGHLPIICHQFQCYLPPFTYPAWLIQA